MDLMQSDEQNEIQRTVAAFLAEKMPVKGHGHDQARTAPEISDELWAACCELGWLGLGLPESIGGVGYGLTEEAVLFREIGRGVAPGPFLPGVLSGHVAAAAGDAGLVQRIVSGEVRVAMATPTGATPDAQTFSGELSLVHSEEATHALVVSHQGSAIYSMDEISARAVDSVDMSLSIASGMASGAKAVHFVSGDAIYRRALVLSAAISVGLALEVMRIAVEYSKVREQFGKSIGSFQALKNYAAYMAARCELAESQLFFAALAVEGNFENALGEALTARYTATEAARLNSEHAIQMHGGYGYTTEYMPYRFATRAHVVERMIAVRPQVLDELVRSS